MLQPIIRQIRGQPFRNIATRSFRSSDTNHKSVLRSDLVNIISYEHEVSKAKADRIIGTFLDNIVETVSNDQTVHLNNFGTFGASTSAARMGRNPRTGAEIHIPESKRIKFKAFPAFKAAVNEKL